MKRLWKIFKGFLLIWGAITFVAFLFFIGWFLNFSTSGKIFVDNTGLPKINPVHKDDVRFVLNWCRLGADRIEEVVHSYISARSFTGDHLDGHAIRVTHLDTSELAYEESNRVDGSGCWHRGDALSDVAQEAVDFVAMWLPSQEIPWFPTIEEIRSPKMYVFVVKAQGTYKVIFANPATRMIYYFSARM